MRSNYYDVIKAIAIIAVVLYHFGTCKFGYEMEGEYAEKNEQLKKAYPNCYIDLIEMVRQPNGKVRVFSDDGKFISQDCRHLTKAGAKFYANRINWNRFLN